MRILVTGAAGFVGTHLVRELQANHDVIPTDLEDADLSDARMAQHLVRGNRPDYVVHLAARYGRLLCRDEPHRAVVDNAAATTELAAACAEHDIPVLYTSSSEVYGDHGDDMITEDSELRTPTTIYGLSKLWGEQALRLYMPAHNLSIVRMNMLYGPGQQAGYGRCALATFVSEALSDGTLTVHGGTSRAWLYIGDAVRALRQLIETGHNGLVNLGNDLDTPISLLDLAEMIVDMAASRARIEIASVPAGQIRHKNYDASRLRQIIDWQPEVALRDGLAATIDWERQREKLAA